MKNSQMKTLKELFDWIIATLNLEQRSIIQTLLILISMMVQKRLVQNYGE